MKKLSIFCVGFLLSFMSQANMLPHIQYDGSQWREPVIEDEVNEWAVVDSGHTVAADFDNDGIQDIARILLKKDSTDGFKVVALVSNTPNNPKQFVLEQDDDYPPQSLTIEEALVSDEVIDSACERGYRECEAGEIRKFKVRNPSILLCYGEFSCRVFMWSHRNQNFTKVDIW